MIGFVLSDGIETNLYQTIQFYTLEELFLRPVFLVLIAICVLSILSGLKIIDKAKKLSQTAKVIEYTRKPQLYFAILMSFIGAYTIWATKDLAFLGKIYPQGVGAVMLICSLSLVFQINLQKVEVLSCMTLKQAWPTRKISNLFGCQFFGFYYL